MALAVACAAEAPGRREAAVVEAPVDALPGAIDTYRVGAIEITVLQRASDDAPHPSVSIAVPEGYRLLGGGASVEWSGAGNLLTSAWPEVGGRAWVASSKDHERSSPARIVAQAIVARMADTSPIREGDYLIVSHESARAQHPETRATLPKGFRLVGGGARVNWREPGNLLTASYPDGDGWVVRSKDHDLPSPATVTAFAIGLRDWFLVQKGLHLSERKIDSETATAWPSVSCSLDPGYHIVSGGAAARWSVSGQLLTASAFADRRTWRAASKDHMVSEPGTVTAYCLGISN
jgi:hypothetical protein